MKFEELKDIPIHLLKSTLEVEYLIFAKDIIQLGGYSNRTFHIKENSGKEFIARVANPLKNEVQLNNENYVLTQLHQKGYHNCPAVIGTVSALSFSYLIVDKSRYPLQVFEFIPGSVNYGWEERCSGADLLTIFTHLPKLHKEMKQIPVQNLNRVNAIAIDSLLSSAIKNQPIGSYLVEKQHIFLKKAAHLTELQNEIIDNSNNLQWIHGDVHLENLLFLPDNAVAFIDFENVQVAPLELDIIFSAFRIAKMGKADEKLIYHKQDLRLAFESYASQNKNYAYLAEQLDLKEQLWKAMFCLDQTFLYLIQAYKGVWQLEKGIGFLACFNEVCAYEE
ncbi:hypothetical protein C9994_03095 [Marivirga lumbricoides]|uniref:Aminoglycoside phosphotransferase domain-containing protein n=1 Tax=Marivirga lumbricoides TaxID=1046115 RepID=A0A2T4DUE0_9BACT|nr:hypothetical protein C9994_03095 [Marivirga lumbricoides]